MTQPTSAVHQKTSRLGLEVEDVVVRVCDLRQVAAGGVQDPLGFPVVPDV